MAICSNQVIDAVLLFVFSGQSHPQLPTHSKRKGRLILWLILEFMIV